MRFIGDVTWRQAGDPVWTTSDFGLDQARIPWRGAITLKKDFEDEIVKFGTMPGYDHMYLTHISDDGALIFPTVDMHYIGIRGSTPQPVITNSRVVQTVTTSGTTTVTVIDENGEETEQERSITLEATYYSSRTSYRWIERQVPLLNPRFKDVLMAAPIQPFGYRTEAPGAGNTLVEYQHFITLFNQLAVRDIVSDYTREEVIPGKIWQCEAVIDRILIG